MDYAAAGKSVLKKGLQVGKWAGKSTAAGILISFAVAEIISRLADSAVGNPKVDVDAILKQGKAGAGTEARMALTRETDVSNAVGESFSGMGIRPEKRITELALMRSRASEITPDGQPVLSFVSQQLGISPSRLSELSSPARMGDYSEFGTIPQMYPEVK
jgi:hypothetical protein